MREHGELILRLTSLLGLTRLRDSVVVPAIADMRHECARAGATQGGRSEVLRGYWSILTGIALYATVQPARSIRENWCGIDAAGPRLLRNALPPALIAGAILLVISLSSSSHDPRLGPQFVALLIPSSMAAIAPLVIAIGVAWTLSRSGSSGRGAFGVGLIAAGFSFVFFDTVVVNANQAYRQAAFTASTGRTAPLTRGSREMTLADLTRAASTPPVTACPIKPMVGSSCGQSSSVESLNTEWHNRLVIPALALPFVLLAAMLSRTSRRLVAIPALCLTNGVTFMLLRLSEAAGMRGELPVAVAAWSAALVPLFLAFAVHMLTRERMDRAIAA